MASRSDGSPTEVEPAQVSSVDGASSVDEPGDAVGAAQRSSADDDGSADGGAYPSGPTTIVCGSSARPAGASPPEEVPPQPWSSGEAGGSDGSTPSDASSGMSAGG